MYGYEMEERERKVIKARIGMKSNRMNVRLSQHI